MLQNGPECFEHASKFQNRSPWNPLFFSHSVSLCNIMYHYHSIHSHSVSFPCYHSHSIHSHSVTFPFYILSFPFCNIPIPSFSLWNIPMISFPFHPFRFCTIPIPSIPIMRYCHSGGCHKKKVVTRGCCELPTNLSLMDKRGTATLWLWRDQFIFKYTSPLGPLAYSGGGPALEKKI